MDELSGGIELWISAAALVLLAGWMLATLVPRMWRDAAYVERIGALGSFFGERLGGALAALAPVGTGLLFLTGAMMLVALAERDIFGSGPSISALRFALALVVFAAVLLGLAVLLFGRPRFVIPPATRSRSGLLARHSEHPDDATGAGAADV